MSDYFLLGALVAADTAIDDLNAVLVPMLDRYVDETFRWWATGSWGTGAWSDYNPTADPANWISCELCHGTGHRDDDYACARRAEDRRSPAAAAPGPASSCRTPRSRPDPPAPA